jgi:hypothetical protein
MSWHTDFFRDFSSSSSQCLFIPSLGEKSLLVFTEVQPSLILYTAVFRLCSGKTVANYNERTDEWQIPGISNILLNCRIINNTVQTLYATLLNLRTNLEQCLENFAGTE